jgi:hypothetical protein
VDVKRTWLVLLLCCGCGPKQPCSDPPSTCPAVHPTWDQGFSSTIVARCEPCHRPGQYSPYIDSHDHATAAATPSLDQVAQGWMPPADAGGFALSPQERCDLLTWYVCGTP